MAAAINGLTRRVHFESKKNTQKTVQEKKDDTLRKLWKNIHPQLKAPLFESLEAIRKRLQDPKNTERITSLALNNLHIEYLPEELGCFTNLTYLSLEDNQLTILPKAIGNLTHLKKLFLKNNRLRFLPEEFWNLTELRELSLGDNDLKDLSVKIGNLTKLIFLNLSCKQLRKVPDEVSRLIELQDFFISQEQYDNLSSKTKSSMKDSIHFITKQKPKKTRRKPKTHQAPQKKKRLCIIQ